MATLQYNFIKKKPPHQKILCRHTSGTFAFAAYTQVHPKGKSKRATSPTLY